MLFNHKFNFITAVEMKALSNGTIAVCLKMKKSEKEARNASFRPELQELKRDQSKRFLLLQYDSMGNILFKNTMKYAPYGMTEVMVEKKMCLVFSHRQVEENLTYSIEY